MKAIKKTMAVAAVCLFSLFRFLSGALIADAYTAIDAAIPVSCLAIADDSARTYEIRIEPVDEVSPVPTSNLLRIAENGTGYFEIRIEYPGTYSYEIYEIQGDDPDITYDSSIYHVVVFVENGTGDELLYSVTASIAGSDKKLKEIEFQDAEMNYDEINVTDLPETTAPAATSPSISTDPAETTVPVTTEPVTEAATESITEPATEPATESTSEAVTDVTTAVTAPPSQTTTEQPEVPVQPIMSVMENVLTGDSFPAHLVRLALLISGVTAVSAILFKRRHREEDDENEN